MQSKTTGIYQHMKNTNRVRIADIARSAGVSAGTVDRVLHNRGEVSEKTSRKVLGILRELNYEPDLLASTLASKKVYRFATLIPEANHDNLFWQQPALGLKKALNSVKHFGVEHIPDYYNYFNQDSFEEGLERILESRPDGVIVAPLFAEKAGKFVDAASEKGIAVVFINMNVTGAPKLAFVGQDPHQSGMVAAHLLDLCTSCQGEIIVVNIISEKGGSAHLLSREEGFRKYFAQKQKAGLYISSLNILGNDPERVRQTLSEGLLKPDGRLKASGIFVTNSRVYQVAHFLEAVGKGDTRLVGYDLLEASIGHLKHNHIDFLISQNPVEQGYRSFMALFNALVLKKEVAEHQYLPIDIVSRENIQYYLNP